MSSLEDRLQAASRQLRLDVEAGLDVEQALSEITDVSVAPAPNNRRRTAWLIAAAAAGALAIAATAVALTGDEPDKVIADSGPTTTPLTQPAPMPTTTTPPPTTEPAPPEPTEPDLEPAQPGREITFDGVGDISLEQVLDPAEVSPDEGGGPCGYWGPGEPSHNGDEPLNGLATGAGTSTPEVVTIMVWRNPTYRTASGVGIGTTLASLERVYGNGLVVDRMDGWESPTEGLLAQYQDVAAVRNGDRALTFYLRDDRVATVKLSSAAFWGDDEGCV